MLLSLADRLICICPDKFLHYSSLARTRALQRPITCVIVEAAQAASAAGLKFFVCADRRRRNDKKLGERFAKSLTTVFFPVQPGDYVTIAAQHDPPRRWSRRGRGLC